jgi:hypothetical protein
MYNHQSPVNHFCTNIPQKRFRMLASEIERMVDRKNYLNKMRKIFSRNAFEKIQEIGLRECFKKGIRILINN